ncbi:hypothetical protein [Limosilactobacillus oris]|nr:hypothetical protein [Limosilactobacillus oris]VTX69395.1 Uncharacterised protein [Limosilactobacillus oris]
MTDQLANNYLKLLSDSLNVQGMIILVTFLGIVELIRQSDLSCLWNQ